MQGVTYGVMIGVIKGILGVSTPTYSSCRPHMFSSGTRWHFGISIILRFAVYKKPIQNKFESLHIPSRKTLTLCDAGARAEMETQLKPEFMAQARNQNTEG